MTDNRSLAELRGIEPGFAPDDERARLFQVVAELADHGATRDQLRDAAVWATALFECDYLALVEQQSVDGAVELLLAAAHDGFACECCGFHSLSRPPKRGSGQICTVCGWEDSDPTVFEVGGWNQLDLDSAQSHLAEAGIQPHLRDLVVPPTRRQARRRPWQTFESRRDALLDRIEAIFSEVVLAGGMTLEDARAADDYDRPRPEYDYERSQPWTAVTDERLEQAQEWVFLDDRGAFFYLAPAMRFLLRHRAEAGAAGQAIWSLLRYRIPELGWLFEHANPDQLRFVAEVLGLASDPWLAHSPRWQLGWSAKDRRRMARLAQTITARLEDEVAT